MGDKLKVQQTQSATLGMLVRDYATLGEIRRY
jgi:hypothetical protein